MPVGGAALSAAREVQIPILAMLLIGACVAKAQRAIRTRSIDAAISPTAMFPLRLRKPITLALCASELAIGGGLVVTAGPLGQGGPAATVRVLAALLFGTAVGALYELRSRRPDIGCGCFGDLSDTPVSVRTLARSALLCVAAIV
ncbi:MAG TPA: MauE/DoxX family redox-associated membrane protein, partial [Trebonia sp.]